jgi:thiamine transport system substrate-binding protein
VVTACGSDDGTGGDAAESTESGSTDEGAVGAGADGADGDGADDEAEPGDAGVDGAAFDGVVVRLVTHDSFNVSEGIFDTFTAETGAEVDVVQAGDAGEVVSRAILTAGEPEGDVLFGIDNTFLQRGLDADLFEPYESPGLADVPDDLELDDEHRVTPIDVGDVCVNYWIDALPGGEAPATLDDLTAPTLASSFVTQNPETSSPGFAFLLATIAAFGEEGWEEYWQELADGGVTVTSGWEDAYYGEFVGAGGEKSLVTSYATSPAAEVLFAEPPVEEAPTGVLLDGCFRQIEFAGVLAGTEQPEAAAALIDFMLSETFQADIPLNMFVHPANETVELPEVFVEHSAEPEEPLLVDPAEIEANRSEWTERWAEIVLR